ncbi:MAG: phytoene desaturase family protein [Promethearchaeota archaeon]
MKYDAIIIGAGVGGLATDAILTLNGYKTLLIEKNGTIGGRCSGFIHKFEGHDILVDYGCHVINRCQYGPIQELLEKLNIADELKWFNSDKIPFVVIEGNERIGIVGVDLSQPGSIIPFDKEKFIAKGLDPKNYKDLYNKMLRSLKGVSPKKSHRYNEVDFRTWIEEKQLPPGIKDILTFLFIAGIVSLSSEGSVGEYFRIIFYVLDASVKAMMDKKTLSLGYPIGGCRAIPETIWKGIEKIGGELLLNDPVKEIIIENNKVVGVITQKGEKHEAPIIISNIGLKETMLNLVKNDLLAPEYIEQIRSLKPSLGVLALRLLLDKKISDLPYLFAVQKDTEKYFKQFDEGIIPEYPPMVFIPMISNMSPNLVPDGYQLLLPAVVLDYNVIQDDNWEPWEKMLENTVYTIFPEIKEHIVWKSFFNSAHAEKLWGKEGGPCIGLAQITSQVADKKHDFRTPIDGLYLSGADVGQEVSGVGVELAITSGMKCAEMILKNKN